MRSKRRALALLCGGLLLLGGCAGRPGAPASAPTHAPAPEKTAAPTAPPSPTPGPVIPMGSPEAAGLPQSALDTIDEILRADIAHGFPGGQLAVVKNGRMVCQKAWGSTNACHADGTPKTDSPAVTNDTLYDLASNTKMYAVNYALQYLASRGQLDLNAKIVDILGEGFAGDTIPIAYAGYPDAGLAQNKAWKAGLTVQELLCHQAGFPADPRYNSDVYDQVNQRSDGGVKNVLYSGVDGSEETRRATLEAICKTPLLYAPGSQTLYSDVDYMLLGFVAETLTGQRLDEFLAAAFYGPMGLTHITYNPLRHGFAPGDCAATEPAGNTRDGAIHFTGIRTQTIQGEVHDEKAYYAMGGVSGHAGLFANAGDLARLAALMLDGSYGGRQYFTPAVIDTFTAPNAPGNDAWGLGWWRQGKGERSYYFSDYAPESVVGHQGWTGTLTMIDRENALVVVYLTNKINTPVTDPANAPNQFDGSWYTSAGLGFVNELIYQGLCETPDALAGRQAELLTRLFGEKLDAAAKNAPCDAAHPAVQAAYALAEVLVERAEKSRSEADIAAAQAAIAGLDAGRDGAEITVLQAQTAALTS